MIKYNDKQVRQICDEAKGLVIESLEYVNHTVGNSSYWVMTFTNGSEISFKFMSEII
jgi:hypothetical protein